MESSNRGNFVIGFLIVCLIALNLYSQNTTRVKTSENDATIDSNSQASYNNYKESQVAMKHQQNMFTLFNTLKSLETKIARMTDNMNRIQRELDTLNLSAQGMDDSKDSEPVMTQEEMMEIIENRRMQMDAEFDYQFSSELEDAHWSQTTETKILDRLANVSDRVSTINFQCKSSMCRLDFAQTDDMTDSDSALSVVESELGWKGEMYFNYNSETGEGVAYLARDGFSLPTLDES